MTAALRYDPCSWCGADAVTVDEAGDDACERCGVPLVAVELVVEPAMPAPLRLIVIAEPVRPLGPGERHPLVIPEGAAFDGLRALARKWVEKPRRSRAPNVDCRPREAASSTGDLARPGVGGDVSDSRVRAGARGESEANPDSRTRDARAVFMAHRPRGRA